MRGYGEAGNFRHLYRTARWLKVASLAKTYNPICQRILTDDDWYISTSGKRVVAAEAGEQCHKPATTAHHLVPPQTTLEFFFDWRNLVCLCHDCHKTTEGENLAAPHTYVITKSLYDAASDPNETIRRLEQGLPPFPA